MPQSIVDAIHAADTLIGGKVVPPVGTGKIAPGLTSALESTLDQFNNGGTLYAPFACTN